MAYPINVFVFGDQTYDASDIMFSLLHAHDDLILARFLDSSVKTLRREISKLSEQQCAACPRFSKLAELLPYWRMGELNPALDQALTCICHIGTFLREHAGAGKSYPASHNACLTARCTGFLSAVAVSCSTNAMQLMELGLETVAVAFRIGACAWEIGSLIFSSSDDAHRFPSWTIALAGLQEDQVSHCIEEFTSEQALSIVTRPYISARISSSRCSVSGPPNVLRELFTTTKLSRATKIELPITAPYHAPHLYSASDVNGIIYGVDQVSSVTLIPIISSTTGDSIEDISFYDALRISVEACLQQTIRPDLVAAGVAACLQDASLFAVHHIGTAPDGLGSAVQAALGALIKQIDLNEKSVPRIPKTLGLPLAKSKIAVLSMSGRFPQAPSMDAFWHILKNGIDTHELTPASRWDTKSHVGDISLKALPKNTSGTGFGCWLHDAAQFDTRYFNMSPREAPQVDPAQRIALLTAAEALEQAGIIPGRTSSTEKDRVGVYFGSTSNDWMETNSAQDIDTYFIPGGNRAFTPGRINYHFKFSGPSYSIDTACSSSFAAIHLACNALWKGEVDTAIVGGTNVLTNPDMTAGLDRGHFLSRTGNCKTFDDTADGYCRGEAVATAILKRLEDAVADKDPIQACILSIGTNHSAEADSITRPHVGAQQALFGNILADAGVKITDISYCEMHGTGTQAGDAGETTSVLQSLAPSEPAKAARKPHQRLYIGAAKSNIGHGEAAAGVSSLAKVLLMLKNSTIPPHCGIKTKINHKLPDLDSRNTFIAMTPTPWARPTNGKRQVLLNNFSAAGGNTALVLEDAPEISTSDMPDVRPRHVVAVSAKTPTSLENNLKNLLKWTKAQTSVDNLTLARLSYTTTARRMHLPHRVMVIASDLQTVEHSLQKALDQKEGSSRFKGVPRYVFAFTGQGSQFAGMGMDLFARLKSFRADICRYDQICRRLDLPSIRKLFEDQSAFYDATPTMSQLALVCFQMALYRLWLSFGITPSAVVGHSLGEYPALYAASVLSQADVINIVGQRALLLEKHCELGSHAMLAVRSNASDLETILGPPGTAYEMSCHNGRENVVLGGTRDQMERILSSLQQSRTSHKLLEVPYAYHTSQVEPILEPLQVVARGIRFAKPAIPVISPAHGKVFTEQDEIRSDFVVRHCRDKVDMLNALTSAKNIGLLDEKMMGIEIGPDPVVVKMVKEVAGSTFRTFASVRKGEDASGSLASAMAAFYTAGADINWMAYHSDFDSCQVVLDLPAYAWDLKDYWMQYVHDWSLRKGDPPLIMEPTSLETTCIHRVVENSLSVNGGELVVEADLSRDDLHPMVQGHKVYGVPLCTASVYGDIALTIGEYAKRYLEPGKANIGVEVADMNIQSALVANADGQAQILQTKARFDAKTKSLSCTFSSVGKVKEQHSNCLIRLFDIEEARNAIVKDTYHVKSRFTTLQQQLRDMGNTFRFSKGMIYKMVSKLADFDPKYRALEEITLDSDNLEATGRVSFAQVNSEGKFHTNPAYIDALSQLGGFVMNGNEGVDLDKELFVNHGWESLKLFEPVDPTKTYYTHVQMKEGKDKLWTGDITIMDKDQVVGMFGGVALQGVPKRLMNYIINVANKRANGSNVTKPTDTASKQGSVVPAAPAVVKTTAKQTPVAQPQREDGNILTAVSIISQESGIALSELTDDTCFDDIGVDSLLSLMISSRIRDELGIEFDSATFLEVRTMGSFKAFLRGLAGPNEAPAITETVQEEVAPTAVEPPCFSNDIETTDTTWTKIVEMIAEESGINVAELTPDTNFSDIGVDSLLSLVVVSRMRDELDLDIPDQSLFLDFPTVESLKARMTGARQSPQNESEASDSDLSTEVSSIFTYGGVVETPIEEVYSSENKDSIISMSEILAPVKPAWSIVLQGSTRHAKEKLFLFPDGCGAATSYLKLPALSPCTAVVAFNSPFMKNPQEMNNRKLPEIIASYTESVRQRQPRGPYHLAGWSAGGILAYAVAQELMATGDDIATLTLIDSPAPNHGLDRLPQRFFDHCSAVGIFGEQLSALNQSQDRSKIPDWLMPHFQATIELLHDYHAPPMPVGSSSPRKVSIVWAGACAFGTRYAPFPSEGGDSEGVRFLTQQRMDFGPGAWADLFPGRRVGVDVIEGEHHFSMMRGKGGEQLGRLMKKVLGLAV